MPSRLPSMGFRPPGDPAQQMGMMMPQGPLPLDNLLRQYLNQEGIDRRYSHLILRELHDATDLNDDQLNQAAAELISTNSGDRSRTSTAAPGTPDFNNSNV